MNDEQNTNEANAVGNNTVGDRPAAPPPMAPAPGSHLRWHRLSELTRDDIGRVELLAATCVDGIGVIARWTRRKDGRWNVTAMDTEGNTGMQYLTNFDDGEPVPPEPPTVFDDVNTELSAAIP